MDGYDDQRIADQAHRGYYGRHEFVAVGYRTDGPRGATDPELVIVKNSEAMKHQFDVYRMALGDKPFIFQTAGWPVEQRFVDAMQRVLATSVKRNPRQPDRIIDDLLHIVRETSRESQGHVGTATLITTIPRAAVPLDTPYIAYLEGPGPKDYRECHVSVSYPNESNQNVPEVFHAAFISQEVKVGGAVMRLGTADPIGPLDGMI